MLSPKSACFLLLAIVGVTVGVFLTKPIWSPEPIAPGPPPDFIRLVDAETVGKLQTAITTYHSAKGQTVALVGAVHVADESYYATLNERFAGYDAVLYELVGDPEDLLAEAESDASPNVLRMFQRGLMGVLDLSFQLDQIDYSAPHFVHADLTKEEFAERQKERGETMFTFLLNAAKAQEGGSLGQDISPWQVIRALFSKDRSSKLKLMVAKQFDESDEVFIAMEGENGSAIITDRNERVIEVLEEQVALGKRNLAIFYGAGHLMDLDERLLDLKFRRDGHEWLTAWEITKPE